MWKSTATENHAVVKFCLVLICRNCFLTFAPFASGTGSPGAPVRQSLQESRDLEAMICLTGITQLTTKRGKVSWQIAQREQQQCSSLFFTFVQDGDGKRIVERITAGRIMMLFQVGKSLGHNQWLVRMKLKLAANVGQVWK